jgi:hypothetical protein
MTLTAPLPLWIDPQPPPTLNQRHRRPLTDGATLVLLGELNGFAAAFGLPQTQPRRTPGHYAH